jgi:hypothetical protein
MVETRSGTGTAGPEELIPEEEMDVDKTGESNADAALRDNTEQETLEQRYNRLHAQLRIKRIEEDVEAMERELAGETPAYPVEIAGLLIRRKRPASFSPLGAPRAQLPCPAKPPYFKGKSLKEAADYEVNWKIHLEAIPLMTQEATIKYAATYLLDHTLIS